MKSHLIALFSICSVLIVSVSKGAYRPPFLRSADTFALHLPRPGRRCIPVPDAPAHFFSMTRQKANEAQRQTGGRVQWSGFRVQDSWASAELQVLNPEP